MILVKTGGIPVDGMVIEGNTGIDESVITNALRLKEFKAK